MKSINLKKYYTFTIDGSGLFLIECLLYLNY